MIAEHPLDTYHTFLQAKRLVAHPAGIEVALTEIHPKLFPFQRVLVQWALRKGRAALFADAGLGKSLMQWEEAPQAEAPVWKEIVS
jgi:hypothetical protein